MPRRSAAQALTRVISTRTKCKRTGLSTVTFLGDAVKAFDRIRRDKAIKQWGEVMGQNEEVLKRHIDRHQSIVAITKIGEAELAMKVIEGVAQGDPNGPPLYSTAYTGVLEEEEREREEKGIESIKGSLHIAARRGLPDIDMENEMRATLYVDDHLEIQQIKKEGGKHTKESVTRQISEMVRSIFDTQEKWGVTSGLDKTTLLLELCGLSLIHI